MTSNASWGYYTDYYTCVIVKEISDFQSKLALLPNIRILHIAEKWNSSSSTNLHVEHVLLYRHCSSVILLLLILNFENEFKGNHG
jgi:hypothetical protein